jgi:hypothetical protein
LPGAVKRIHPGSYNGRSNEFSNTTRSHLKNWILVQNRGGGVFQTGGILKYFGDLKQDTNKEFGPKDIPSIAG